MVPLETDQWEAFEGTVLKGYQYIRGDGAAVASPLFQEVDGGSIPTSPLQFKFVEAPFSIVQQLIESWHSRLPVLDKGTALMGPCVGYVAEFEDHWFATAWWSQPVARLLNGRGMIELRRLAICPSSPKNTASRFLSYMVKDIKSRFPDVVQAISYQDTEVHTGTIYKASGWDRLEPTRRDGQWGCKTRFRANAVADCPKVRWVKTIREVNQ